MREKLDKLPHWINRKEKKRKEMKEEMCKVKKSLLQDIEINCAHTMRN
jgi:hypothetical protein